MASIQPGKRSNSPEDIIDPEKGLGTIMSPEKDIPIKVVVHKPTPAAKKPLTGNQVLAQAMGLPYGGKKSRKQKKRVQKKTQKRRARK
jgi:hypothetical protein